MALTETCRRYSSILMVIDHPSFRPPAPALADLDTDSSYSWPLAFPPVGTDLLGSARCSSLMGEEFITQMDRGSLSICFRRVTASLLSIQSLKWRDHLLRFPFTFITWPQVARYITFTNSIVWSSQPQSSSSCFSNEHPITKFPTSNFWVRGQANVNLICNVYTFLFNMAGQGRVFEVSKGFWKYFL